MYAGGFTETFKAGMPPLQFDDSELRDVTDKMDDMMRSLGLIDENSPRMSGWNPKKANDFCICIYIYSMFDRKIFLVSRKLKPDWLVISTECCQIKVFGTCVVGICSKH